MGIYVKIELDRKECFKQNKLPDNLDFEQIVGIDLTDFSIEERDILSDLVLDNNKILNMTSYICRYAPIKYPVLTTVSTESVHKILSAILAKKKNDDPQFDNPPPTRSSLTEFLDGGGWNL
jgi:hypothetical protein